MTSEAGNANGRDHTRQFGGGVQRQNGRPRVVVIEADADYRAVMVVCVDHAGAVAEPMATVAAGLRRLAAGDTDLVVWGVAPDESDRATHATALRERGRVPLILVDESSEQIRAAFEAGADQVLPKPFVPGALVGAVTAGLRATGPTSMVALATRIEVGDVVFDSAARSITRATTTLSLSPREWDLVAFLMANPNQWFGADELSRKAWRTSRTSAEQLRSYIARLRRKMAPLGLPVRIMSRQGRGYSLEIEPPAP